MKKTNKAKPDPILQAARVATASAKASANAESPTAAVALTGRGPRELTPEDLETFPISITWAKADVVRMEEYKSFLGRYKPAVRKVNVSTVLRFALTRLLRSPEEVESFKVFIDQHFPRGHRNRADEQL